MGGEGYILDITSPDGKYALSLSIQEQSAGTYPFINPSQTLSNGKANFLFQSTALPEVYAGTSGILLPSAGNVVLTTATKPTAPVRSGAAVKMPKTEKRTASKARSTPPWSTNIRH